MVSVKDTTKRDLKIKAAYINGDKVMANGEEIDLIETLKKAFGEGGEFDLSASAKSEEESEL